jgi:hypothetical protein
MSSFGDLFSRELGVAGERELMSCIVSGTTRIMCVAHFHYTAAEIAESDLPKVTQLV